ncbi:MAG TPA: PKD domain-containing protein, partial [Saprospiraceae bacterium]|nr:PKD domain-containing protein [Saprospiraceae bacterium]
YLQNLTQDALGARWWVNGALVSNQTDTTLTFDLPGMYRIELVSRNLYGCEDTARYDFRVFPTLTAKAEVDNPEPCQYEVLHFQSLSGNADRWHWDFGNGDTSALEHPQYAYPQTGSYQVTLVAMQGDFCADTFVFPAFFDVRPSPVAGFSVADTLTNGIADGSVICIDTSIGAISWLYNFVDLGTTSTEQNPVVQYTSNFEKTIIQKVFNAEGCYDTAVVRFTPRLFGGLVVPTALMPNASQPGLHTVFRPVGAGLKTYKIEVFSPLGDLVWQSEALAAGVPTGEWDGTDFEGKACPAGAYLWKVEARLESTTEEGRKWDGMPVRKGDGKYYSYGTVTVIR